MTPPAVGKGPTQVSMRASKTRADYVLISVIAAVALVALVATVYVVANTDFVRWDLREHPDTLRYQQRAADPERFFYGFGSYQSVSQVRSMIEATGLHTDFSTSRTLPNADYPQREIDTLTVPEYRYCGTVGELTLNFFNDRLMEAFFEPAEAQACREALFAAYPQLRRDDNGRVEHVEDNLRLATNLDLVLSDVGIALRTRPYVRWQDLRLVASLEEWERRFGAQAILKPAPSPG